MLLTYVLLQDYSEGCLISEEAFLTLTFVKDCDLDFGT